MSGSRDGGDHVPATSRRGSWWNSGGMTTPPGTTRRLPTPVRTLTGVLLLAALLTACAAGENPDVGTAAPGEDNPAGFWLGLWHGLILPITWIVSLFSDTVSPYEVFNNGNWYDFGFVLGVFIIFGGPLARQGYRRR
jgi:hypothetical protein